MKRDHYPQQTDLEKIKERYFVILWWREIVGKKDANALQIPGAKQNSGDNNS